jgi:hypothetical protein
VTINTEVQGFYHCISGGATGKAAVAQWRW